MKKKFTILCAVMLTISLSAQDVKFGIVGGLNIAYPVGNDMEDYIEDVDDQIDYYDDQSGIDAEGGIKPRIGIHLGFSVDFPIADNLYIGSGLIYSQKGFVIKNELKGEQIYYNGNYPYNNYSYVDVERKSRVDIQLNYIDIPIGVKYATDDGFELSGGFIVSILASDNVKVEIDYDGPGYSSDYEDYYDDVDDYDDLFDEDPESMLTGLQIGVGYTFNEKFNISFKLQKTGNFGEINNDDDNQNLTLQLSTGLYF